MITIFLCTKSVYIYIFVAKYVFRLCETFAISQFCCLAFVVLRPLSNWPKILNSWAGIQLETGSNDVYRWSQTAIVYTKQMVDMVISAAASVFEWLFVYLLIWCKIEPCFHWCAIPHSLHYDCRVQCYNYQVHPLFCHSTIILTRHNYRTRNCPCIGMCC